MTVSEMIERFKMDLSALSGDRDPVIEMTLSYGPSWKLLNEVAERCKYTDRSPLAKVNPLMVEVSGVKVSLVLGA